jgi:hypothetical protein
MLKDSLLVLGSLGGAMGTYGGVTGVLAGVCDLCDILVGGLADGGLADGGRATNGTCVWFGVCGKRWPP